MSKENNGAGIGVGSSSILVIFVVLCLTAFATLSLVSANADYKLTQKAALAVQSYYTADCKAEERLAELAKTAAAAPRDGLRSALEDAGFTCTAEGGLLLAGYQIPMDGGKVMCIQVNPLTLERICWQVQPAADQPSGATSGLSNLPTF